MAESYIFDKYLSLLAFSQKLGASELKSDKDFFRKREDRQELREEFDKAVRPIFLKYLPFVDPKTFNELFSDSEKIKIQKGYVPTNWSVHHQKPLAWGGRNFNMEMQNFIDSTPLTEEQIKKCNNDFYSRYSKLRFQLDNLLKQALQENRLQYRFKGLFKGFLILLPKEYHKHMEQEFLIPQAKNFSNYQKTTNSSQEKTNIMPFFYPVWNQFIFHGQHFSSQKEKKPSVSVKGKHTQRFKPYSKIEKVRGY